MSDEKVFRPERRPIDATAEENQQQLNNLTEIRKAAEGEKFEGPDVPGIQVGGKIPQRFQQALQQQRQQMRQPTQERPQMDNDPLPMPQQLPPQPARRGSSKLEELLQRTSQKTVELYEEITLPSKGKFYDGTDGPKDGVLHIRSMTGEEEQILATSRYVKSGQAINMIFDRCIQENYRSENFLTADRTYLLIYLRGISYTPNYDVEVKCPSCDRKFGTTIDLNILEVEYCPDDFSEANLRDQLPTTGFKFTYRLSAGSDERRVQEYRDKKMRGFDTSGQSDDTLLFRTTQSIVDIEGLTDQNEILALLRKLPINDVAYLRNTVTEPPFGVKTTVEIPCPACMSDFDVELPLEAHFFFPRGKKKTPIGTQA